MLRSGIATAKTIHEGYDGLFRLITIAISEEEYQALKGEK